jgi:hypothetical protein
VQSTATASEAPAGGWKAREIWLEAFIILNFLSLTGDIALAHSENRFRVPVEYLPLWFSLVAAVLLIPALFLRLRGGSPTIWKILGYLVGWCSIAIGAAGVVYHLDSQFFYQRTLKSLTYTAPFVAPLAYIGLGCLLVMNRMVEPSQKEWPQWVIFFALGGFVGNFALSLTDHATNGFFYWTEWIPVVSSALAVGFLAVLLFSAGQRAFLYGCSLVLLLQMAVGGLGFVLHVWADLHGPAGTLFEKVVSGAPPFAPLLLPNLSILGFIGIAAMLREAQS